MSFFWLNMLWCSRIFVFFTLLNLNQTRYVSLNLKRSVFSCTLSSAAHRSLWGYLSEHLNRVLTFCAETNFTAAVPFLLSVRCRGNSVGVSETPTVAERLITESLFRIMDWFCADCPRTVCSLQLGELNQTRLAAANSSQQAHDYRFLVFFRRSQIFSSTGQNSDW